MLTRDLYNIILKIFGLLIFKEIFLAFPSWISPLIYMTGSEGIGVVVFSLLVLGFYCFLPVMLLFKTNSVLNLLKLDRDLSTDHVTIDFSKKDVISISLFIVVAYILIDEIPTFCKYIFDYYEHKQFKFNTERSPVRELVVSGAKIIIAFLIIGERKKIVQLIIKEKVTEEAEELKS